MKRAWSQQRRKEKETLIDGLITESEEKDMTPEEEKERKKKGEKGRRGGGGFNRCFISFEKGDSTIKIKGVKAGGGGMRCDVNIGLQRRARQNCCLNYTLLYLIT